MSHVNLDVNLNESFTFDNLEELVKTCVKYYKGSVKNAAGLTKAFERRKQLSRWIEKFHRECGTLTSNVEEAIEKLEDESCVVLMTAHQPNFFAYSGVLRKATLNHVLAEKLSQRLKKPVVDFFGIADQDFTDDRWVKSALLPDVERRGGVFEVRVALPHKVMLNKVEKPPREVFDTFLSQIRGWFERKLSCVNRLCKPFGVDFNLNSVGVRENFQDFFRIAEDAYVRARVYSDFNAFVMSKIVNESWGYGTLFSRFSECQQDFEDEFCFLLSHFQEYSKYVGEATLSNVNMQGGVSEKESETIPFWYHCDCGSKARLTAEQSDGSFIGHGACLRCGKEYRIDFSSSDEPEISGIRSRISARSLSMPLVIFSGLGVCCYVGGVGGKEYLSQSKYVAERMGLTFPPCVIWRPHDVYLGLGQLEALMFFRKFSGTYDFSKYSDFKVRLERKISEIESAIQKIAHERSEVASKTCYEKEEMIKRMQAAWVQQLQIRMQTNFPVLVQSLKLLENTDAVIRLHPSIIDYAINVGLRSASEQWVSFLKNNGSLQLDVVLKTDFDKFFPMFLHELCSG
jgi:hypothetical protein